MNKLIIALLIGSIGIVLDTKAQNGSQEASYDLFYDRLQSDGRWFNDDTYGYVWQPNTASKEQHWRPYTDGRWAYTDRGWTWVSNEKFGWATYHYGRWAKLREIGWVWVPGGEWAPAWVSWRESDDYVGWAPLPPEAQSDPDQPVKIEGWADNYYNIGPAAYVFLKTTDLANPSYRDFLAQPGDNVEFISHTKNVTSIYYGNEGVIDNGPNYDRLVQRANVKIDRYRLNYVEQNRPDTQFGTVMQGDQLRVLAPPPRIQRTATAAPKAASNIIQTQVDRGWQGMDQTKTEQLKQNWAKEAPVPASLPQRPLPPKPVVAGATRQGPQQVQRPGTEQKEGNQPPTPAQPSSQAQRPQTTPPAPRPAQPQNQKLEGQPPAANENRREVQGSQTKPGAPTLPQPRNEGPGQPEQKPPAANENRKKEPPTRVNQPSENNLERSRQKEEQIPHQVREQAPAKQEEQRKEGDQGSKKANPEEPRRPQSGEITGETSRAEKKSESREQSPNERSKKRPEETEKKKTEPPQPQ